jgi:hypothetical protein
VADAHTGTALVVTDQPSRYLKQLCRHFGHKNEVTFDDAEGSIALASGTCRLDAATEGLRLTAEADTEENLAHLQDVIARHLERFGAKDELAVAWSTS